MVIRPEGIDDDTRNVGGVRQTDKALYGVDPRGLPE